MFDISTIQEKELEEMRKTRDKSGIPMSRLIDLKKKGYKIVKINQEDI